jgi:hypothetical protein
MELREDLALIEIFMENASAKRREARAVEAMDRAFEDRKNKDRREEEDRRYFETLMVLASEQQVAAFHDRLERYDTAVVQALMDNERALDDAGKRRDELEAAAYRLPDGRMVFKTEDGMRVLDQNGAELSRDTIDPESIPDANTRWEPFKAIVDTRLKLLQERQELHAFQEKVDSARDTIDKGGVTAKDLDDLGAALQRDMPDSVRQRMADYGSAQEISAMPAPGQGQGVRPASTAGTLSR